MINFDTDTIIYILLGLIVVLVIWILRIEIRQSRLMAGKNGKSLEDAIYHLKKDIEEFEHFRVDSIEYFNSVEGRLKRSIQSVETVRFNPYKGTGSGGNQSFSTSFLNEMGNGVVMTGLHSRDHLNVYSKPVKKFNSEFETTEEEKTVIKASKESLQNKKNAQ